MLSLLEHCGRDARVSSVAYARWQKFLPFTRNRTQLTLELCI